MRRAEELTRLLDQTHSADEAVRLDATRVLCPCQVKYNDPRVWNRLIEMVDDPSVRVRGWVLHNLCDGSPREYQERIVGALESMHDDPDPKLRRRVRKVLAHHRRTGVINVL